MTLPVMFSGRPRALAAPFGFPAKDNFPQTEAKRLDFLEGKNVKLKRLPTDAMRDNVVKIQKAA